MADENDKKEETKTEEVVTETLVIQTIVPVEEGKETEADVKDEGSNDNEKKEETTTEDPNKLSAEKGDAQEDKKEEEHADKKPEAELEAEEKPAANNEATKAEDKKAEPANKEEPPPPPKKGRGRPPSKKNTEEKNEKKREAGENAVAEKPKRGRKPNAKKVDSSGDDAGENKDTAMEEAKDSKKRNAEEEPVQESKPKRGRKPAAKKADKKVEDSEKNKKKDDAEEEDEVVKEPEEEDEEEEEASKEENAAESSTPKRRSERDKRVRAPHAFVPEDFKNVDRSVTIAPGRGTKLSDLPPVRKAIENTAQTSEILDMAHKLLFPRRRKPPKSELKSNLLDFSGFYMREDEDMTAKAEQESDAMLKMVAKTNKLKANDIKNLCDFFTVDRSGHATKESQVDVLLKFLSVPSMDLLKEHKKAEAAADRKAAKKEKTASKESTDDLGSEDLLHPKKGEMPSDETLHKWVKALVLCHDAESANIKFALKVAHEKFGLDMSEKKDEIETWLSEEV